MMSLHPIRNIEPQAFKKNSLGLGRVILILPSGRNKDRNEVCGTGKGDESVSKAGRIDQTYIDHRYDNEGNETDGLWKCYVLEPDDLPRRCPRHVVGLTFEEKKASLSYYFHGLFVGGILCSWQKSSMAASCCHVGMPTNIASQPKMIKRGGRTT
jgi:hypothetical protein